MYAQKADGPTSRQKYLVFAPTNTAGNRPEVSLEIPSGVIFTDVGTLCSLIKSIQLKVEFFFLWRVSSVLSSLQLLVLLRCLTVFVTVTRLVAQKSLRYQKAAIY